MPEPDRIDVQKGIGPTMRNMGKTIFEALTTGPGITKRVVGNQCSLFLTGPSSSGSGSCVIPMVATLPPIPTEVKQLWVYWAKSTEMEGGTGDGQIWIVYKGQTEWTPLQFLTTNSGVPV